MMDTRGESGNERSNTAILQYLFFVEKQEMMSQGTEKKEVKKI